jgi:excisionase family DNA binding protein
LPQHFGTAASIAAPPLAHSVEETASRAGCGRTTVYAAIKAGELKARKIGRRTIILEEDQRRWLASLPMREVA